jgi:hypothetical protein
MILFVAIFSNENIIRIFLRIFFFFLYIILVLASDFEIIGFMHHTDMRALRLSCRFIKDTA